MRTVIDTNVILSGLYKPDSPPGRILESAAEGSLLLCAPEAVRTELERTLRRVLGYSAPEVASTLRSLPLEWIEHEVYDDFLDTARKMLRDEDDAPILACALVLGCDIVSGDQDLHAARQNRVRVWKPADLAGKA